MWRECRAYYVDHRHPIRGARLGEEIELGHEVAAKVTCPRVKCEPVADDVKVAVTQIEGADHIGNGERSERSIFM